MKAAPVKHGFCFTFVHPLQSETTVWRHHLLFHISGIPHPLRFNQNQNRYYRCLFNSSRESVPIGVQVGLVKAEFCWAEWTVGMVFITKSWVSQLLFLNHFLFFPESCQNYRGMRWRDTWGDVWGLLKTTPGNAPRQHRGRLVTAAGIPGSRPLVRCCLRSRSSLRSL